MVASVVQQSSRLVVKVGSSLVTNEGRGLDHAALSRWAAEIAALNKAGAFRKPVVTKIENGEFFPAERYHQDFMRRNPNHPYIQRWDVPRLKKLKATYPALYRDW